MFPCCFYACVMVGFGVLRIFEVIFCLCEKMYAFGFFGVGAQCAKIECHLSFGVLIYSVFLVVSGLFVRE